MRGVSRQSVNELVSRGILTLHDGKLNVEEADAACLERLDPARSAVLNAVGRPDADTFDPDADSTATYQAARAMREGYEARIAKLEFLEKKGELVDAGQIENAFREIGREVREKLMNLSPRLSPMLAAETDPRKIDQMLTVDIRRICDDLANKFAQLIRADR